MNILTSQVKQKEQAVKKVQEKVDSRTEKKIDFLSLTALSHHEVKDNKKNSPRIKNY